VLIYLRMEKNAYANVRPLKLYPGVFPEGDFALEHEGSLWDDKGVDKRVITHFGAHRIAMFVFNYAVRQGRRKVTCVDQSNWLYSDKLFRSAFERVAERQARVESECMSVDVAAMMQARDPTYFDVVVAPDIYGDILSGYVIGQIGGVGMAPSACIGDNFAFFEPIHGTAWDIAGKGVANPIASILSAKLMLEWLGHPEEAKAIEEAVCAVLLECKVRTPDLEGGSSTQEMGDAVKAYVENGPPPMSEDQEVLQRSQAVTQ